MPEASYDDNYAPIPWRAFSQFKEDRGKVCTWIEDALGGVVVPDCTPADAMLIVGAVNAHNDLVKSQQETLMLMRDDYAVEIGLAAVDEESAAHEKAKVYEHLIAMAQAALAKAKPVEATELAPIVSDEPVTTAPPVDIEALGAKTRELAAADGWDGSYDRKVAKDDDIRPGPMSKERWAEFTAKAMKEIK